MVAMKTNKDDSFESLANVQTFTNGVNGRLQQNSVFNPSKTKKDLMSDNRIEIDMKELELASDISTGFNAIHEYDSNVYCIELIIAIYKMNWKFQNEFKRLSNSNYSNLPCIYKSASIKTKQRCQVKAALEYADCAFPQTDCILDFSRCSIIFETAKHLVYGLSNLISFLYKHDDKSDEYKDDTIQHVMKKILRNKNGFHVLCFGMPKFGMPISGMPKLRNAKTGNAKIWECQKL